MSLIKFIVCYLIVYLLWNIATFIRINDVVRHHAPKEEQADKIIVDILAYLIRMLSLDVAVAIIVIGGVYIIQNYL